MLAPQSDMFGAAWTPPPVYQKRGRMLATRATYTVTSKYPPPSSGRKEQRLHSLNQEANIFTWGTVISSVRWKARAGICVKMKKKKTATRWKHMDLDTGKVFLEWFTTYRTNKKNDTKTHLHNASK